MSGELLALPFVSDEPCALRVDDALGFDPFRQTTQGRGPATREPAARRSALARRCVKKKAGTEEGRQVCSETPGHGRLPGVGGWLRVDVLCVLWVCVYAARGVFCGSERRARRGGGDGRARRAKSVMTSRTYLFVKVETAAEPNLNELSNCALIKFAADVTRGDPGHEDRSQHTWSISFSSITPGAHLDPAGTIGG